MFNQFDIILKFLRMQIITVSSVENITSRTPDSIRTDSDVQYA